MRMLRIGPATFALTAAALLAPSVAMPAAQASQAAAAHHHHRHHHGCTRTSSGTCIQGGEFCPAADNGKYGWDANGRKYICRDGHWEVP
jgi:hypothetical protein